MKEEIKNPFPDKNCFFCGSDNNLGLKLKFYWDQEKKEASTEYLPVPHFVGQGKTLHGGIQMGLLDEIMGWTSYVFIQKMAVTSDLNVKFLHPTYICGEKINVTCRVTSQEGSKVNMQAIILNIEGVVCTIATGTYHILPPDKYKDLIHGSYMNTYPCNEHLINVPDRPLEGELFLPNGKKLIKKEGYNV